MIFITLIVNKLIIISNSVKVVYCLRNNWNKPLKCCSHFRSFLMLRKIFQLSKEIASLQEQLAVRESELAELKQLKAIPAQNGLSINSNNDEEKVNEILKVFRFEIILSHM